MLQQIDISAPEDFNLISTQNRNNHSCWCVCRVGGGTVLEATPTAPRCSIAVTLAGGVGFDFEGWWSDVFVSYRCHRFLQGSGFCFFVEGWYSRHPKKRRNERTFKREGTFKGQMDHVSPQLIVLLNPQSHSVVFLGSFLSAHVWSAANHNYLPPFVFPRDPQGEVWKRKWIKVSLCGT